MAQVTSFDWSQPALMKILKLSALLGAFFALALPAASHAATPGVNLTEFDAGKVDQAALLGVKRVRVFIDWDKFEPSKGNLSPFWMTLYQQGLARMNAHGMEPVFVLLNSPAWARDSSNPASPPRNVEDFADFASRIATQFRQDMGGTRTIGYEIWNEPDENQFWSTGADPVRYAALVKTAYGAIHAADGHAKVVLGPTTGNNYNWVEKLYDNGIKGFFDVAAVHTDTACLIDAPDSFYRDNNRLAQFTFLAYREVRASMEARGDAKPIWMTELGWSTTGLTCSRGMWAGQKPAGVSEAKQAEFLTHAYRCLANDPYLENAIWFNFQDFGTTDSELGRYGLLRPDGSPKPSYAAFKAIVGAAGGSAGDCGDFTPPTLRVLKPAPNTQFVDKLDVQAAASDGGVGLARITFNYNGGTGIRNYTDALANDKPVGLAPWQGSGKLPVGKYVIEVLALDKNGNTTTVKVPVEKVTTLASTLTPRFKLKSKKVACKRGVCKISGSLSRGKAGSPSIGGKVAVEWQFRNKKGKWRKLIGGLKPASKPFTFTAKPKQKGRWRVRVVYRGQAPWKKSASKFLAFRV